jgi:CheY-like chemotaxis protein
MQGAAWHSARAADMVTTTTERPASRVLVLGADAATVGLLDEWLAADGWQVVTQAAPGTALALAVIDVPFARDGCAEQARDVGRAHPDTPLLAMSATLFGSVMCNGDCARKLGVAGVLPKPLAREALRAAVHRFARR